MRLTVEVLGKSLSIGQFELQGVLELRSSFPGSEPQTPLLYSKVPLRFPSHRMAVL